jgi:serine protease
MKKIILLVILLSFSAQAEIPWQAKIDPQFLNTKRIVLQLKAGASSLARSGSAELAAVSIFNELGVINKVAGTLPLVTSDSSRVLNGPGGNALKRFIYADLNSNGDSDLIAELNNHPDIEIAHYSFIETRPPAVDAAPTTPLFGRRQGYRKSAARKGLDSNYINTLPGGKGNNITVVDIEYKWVTRHEDLPTTNRSIIFNNAPGAFDKNHGTAVIGIIAGVKNRYGVAGMAPNSTVLLAKPYDTLGSYSVAAAINEAVNQTFNGDVILLEQQYNGGTAPCWCGSTCTNYLPVEAGADVFAAIQNATALGRVVVEAAGNGGQDLDDPSFLGWYDWVSHNSGAIMVGAIDKSNMQAYCYSNIGSRIDVSAWGGGVITTGYGDLFDPLPGSRLRKRQQYTAAFAGTSSASAIIAGATAAFQGHAFAHGILLSSSQLISYYRANGTATADTGNLGYMPNLRAAAERLAIDYGF